MAPCEETLRIAFSSSCSNAARESSYSQVKQVSLCPSNFHLVCSTGDPCKNGNSNVLHHDKPDNGIAADVNYRRGQE